MDVNTIWAYGPAILSVISFLTGVISAWLHRPLITLGAVAAFILSVFRW